jgi:hypothetical protein
VPFKSNARPLDLTQHECDALTAYVSDLSAPVGISPSGPRQSHAIEAGNRTFRSIGCAVCHAPSLGNIQGIYSDLLLHDMGPKLSDVGGYYNDSEDPDSPNSPSVSEWRSPPLRGVHDSGPYVHDGRAVTLQQAIIEHGGQATESVGYFRELSAADRSNLLAFLHSLVAPASNEPPPNPAVARPPHTVEVREATAAATRRATARLRAAQMLETLGKTSEALARYRMAVQEAPDSRAGRAAAERIGILTGK